MGFRVWLGREVAMQIIVRWISIIFAVLTAIPAVAGSIGFLDTERALKTVKEGQRQYQILDAWANQRADEVEAKQNRVTELTQQLNAQRTAASADVIRKLEEDLLQAQRDLEDAGRALQTDFQSKQSELLDGVASRLRTVAADYAAANSIDAIFILKNQPLVYIADSAIITDAVIRLYDERFPIE
jgi:Skp family chaperone for outer membrane proteins